MHASPEISSFVTRLCRGAKSCPHAVIPQDITQDLNAIVEASGWPQFLAQHYRPLRHHHQFRLTVSSCPNGCTQPHIADFALIAHASLTLESDACSQCGECLKKCAEQAISLDPLFIDSNLCLGCAACTVCSFGAIRAAQKSYRILLGGKLGRHPRLAHELGRFELPNALIVLHKTLDLFMANHRPGMRLGDLILELGQDNFDKLVRP